MNQFSDDSKPDLVFHKETNTHAFYTQWETCLPNTPNELPTNIVLISMQFSVVYSP